MDKQPYEILAIIMGFVDDNIRTSMTCHLFRDVLQKMYKSKQLMNVNDPYVLSRHHKKYGFRVYDIIKKDMDKITNHKCLNFIGDILFANGEQGFVYEWGSIYILLFQNCITNNASRPTYFPKMLTQIKHHLYRLDTVYERIILVTLASKSFDVFVILMQDLGARQIWGTFIFRQRYLNESDINVIIKEMDILMENKVMSANEILNFVRLHANDLKLRYEIMEYLFTKATYEEPIIIYKDDDKPIKKPHKPSFLSSLFGYKSI